MEPETQSTDLIADLTEHAVDFYSWGASLYTLLSRTWNLYQIGIIVVLLLVALLVGWLIRPRLRHWLRDREGWPKWRLRAMAVVSKRLEMIVFVILIWATVMIMREVTWSWRSWILGIVAELSTAWLIVVFATRLIGNSLLRGIVRYGAWIWVTIAVFNLTDDARQLLDSIAFNFGEMRLSLWVTLQAFIALVVLFTAARFLARSGAAAVRGNDDISPSMQVLAVKFIQVVLYSAAFFLGLKAVGVDLTGLAVLSGAIGIGVGFGLQKVVSNLVSGIIILLDKSIKPGDVISIGETFGWVESLGARYVSITTRDGREYLVPNEDLITGQVVNWSYSNTFVRIDLTFGASYGDDPHLVRKLAIQAATGCDRVLSHRPPVCHITGFGDNSVDYVLRFWITDPSGGLANIRGNVYLALWDTFRDNAISIPFPQREVRILDPEPVHDPVAGTKPKP